MTLWVEQGPGGVIALRGVHKPPNESVVLRFFFTVELLPLFAEMFGRFCLNCPGQSDDENRGRHFRPGAGHHRIRDLFGCRVDERRGLSHCSPGPCDGGRRPCAQTRLGAKVACEGLAIRQTKTARRRSVLGETPLSWQGNSSSRVAGGAALTISDVESGSLLSGLIFPLRFQPSSHNQPSDQSFSTSLPIRRASA